MPAYRFEIPTDDEGNSLLSDDDRARAIEAIRQTEEATGRFIPMTPAVIWQAHMQLRNKAIQQRALDGANLPQINSTMEPETSGMFDNDPLDQFRDGSTGEVMRQLNVRNYDQLKALAESEIPTAEAQRAVEMLREVDRVTAVQTTEDPLTKYTLMTPEERKEYLKTLTYDERFSVLQSYRMREYQRARENS